MKPLHWGASFALIAAFLFASKAIFIKQAYALSPLVNATNLLTLRMLSALPFFILLIYFAPKHKNNLLLKDWLLLIFAGLLGYYFASWLDFIGLMYISASLERIILFLYPTLTVLASTVIFKHKLSLKIWLAILLSYSGTVIVMLAEHQGTGFGQNIWLGSSLVFASAVAFAAYLLITPRLIERFGSWRFTGLAMTVACLGTIVHYMLATPHPITALISLPMAVYGYGIALGFFVTVLPTILLMQSIVRIGPSRAAMIGAGGPIFTIILAVLFLHEQLNGWQWVGCALNILGVLMVSFSSKRT